MLLVNRNKLLGINYHHCHGFFYTSRITDKHIITRWIKGDTKCRCFLYWLVPICRHFLWFQLHVVLANFRSADADRVSLLHCSAVLARLHFQNETIPSNAPKSSHTSWSSSREEGLFSTSQTYDVLSCRELCPLGEWRHVRRSSGRSERSRTCLSKTVRINTSHDPVVHNTETCFSFVTSRRRVNALPHRSFSSPGPGRAPPPPRTAPRRSPAGGASQTVNGRPR